MSLLLCVWLLLKYQKVLELQEKACFWLYIILPVIAILIQMMVYGLVVLSLANMISLVVIFLFLQAKQGQRNAKQELQIVRQNLELTDSRTKVMLSQIQPHFLYNALTSIRYLCEKDALAAQKALGDFSDYLRGNLDSLTKTAPVPFEKELKHLQIYLSLEKMRFDDELSIVYDIQTTAFVLPALTVQPIVENAVRYGVGKKIGGGTVTITTKENADTIEIIVSDDGVGYDPMQMQQDGRSHIGIDNVRSRLKAMVDGTLEIQSQKGIGTTVMMRLPKKISKDIRENVQF